MPWPPRPPWLRLCSYIYATPPPSDIAKSTWEWNTACQVRQPRFGPHLNHWKMKSYLNLMTTFFFTSFFLWKCRLDQAWILLSMRSYSSREKQWLTSKIDDQWSGGPLSNVIAEIGSIWIRFWDWVCVVLREIAFLFKIFCWWLQPVAFAGASCLNNAVIDERLHRASPASSVLENNAEIIMLPVEAEPSS